jgi:hypothetical protein
MLANSATGRRNAGEFRYGAPSRLTRLARKAHDLLPFAMATGDHVTAIPLLA